MIKSLSSLFFSILLIQALCAIETENGVIVINQYNFETVVSENPNILVKFYTEWW